MWSVSRTARHFHSSIPCNLCALSVRPRSLRCQHVFMCSNQTAQSITAVWVHCAAERGMWRACSWPWGRKKRTFRTIPRVTKQFKLLLRRAGVQWVRGWSYKFIDMLLFVGAALVVGEPYMDQCRTCMTGCNTVTVMYG